VELASPEEDTRLALENVHGRAHRATPCESARSKTVVGHQEKPTAVTAWEPGCNYQRGPAQRGSDGPKLSEAQVNSRATPSTRAVAMATESIRPFVGRAQTVEALHRRFEDAEVGTGGVTLLVGDTGVGKSTLVDELVRDIRAHGIRVLIGRALALDDPPPFSLFHSAFDSTHGDPARGLDETPVSGGDQFLIGFAPGIAETTSLAPVAFEERLLDALGVTGERVKMSRDWVQTRIADQFLEFTRHSPMILILDELQRADDSSLTAVEYLANQLQNRPLWILATSCPYASLTESRRARIEGFESATHAQQILLPPLTSGEVADYLRVNDPSRDFSPDEVARRFTETGGNPLLLQQFDRRLSSGGDVRDRSRVDLPPLDVEAQRTLDIAAVLGPEFSFALLLGVSDEEQKRLTEIVDRLVDRGLLFRRPGDLLEFPQDRLREEAYNHLTESHRRRLHRRAGETREAMGSVGSTHVFGLARDFYLGQADEKSVEYNRVAAEIAERALAPDVARDFFARALESQRSLDPEDRDGESKLVLELGRLTYELGRLEEAEGILRDFLERAKDDPRLAARIRATLGIYLAQVLTARGNLPAAAGLAEKILSTPGLEDQPLIRIGAHHQLGLTLYYEGHYSEALAHHTEEIRLARETGNERVIAHAQKWRAAVLAMMGNAEEALAGAREVAAVLDRSGSAGESAQGHLFLGNMLADNKSDPLYRQEAITELAMAIRLGEKAQDPRRVGWAHYFTAELLREQGRFKEAAENAQRAFDTLGRIGDRVGQGVSIKVRGQIAKDLGSYALAETDLIEAQRLLQGLNHTLEEIDVVLRLAQLSYARGDHGSALRHITELERQNLTAVRPDLAEEFEHLKQSLATKGVEGDVP
jgi:tetratricopeptide (TPR) repeat protein